MSKIFLKKLAKRISKNELFNIKNILDNLFKKEGIYIKSNIPNLFIDKKDYGDLDYFLMLKNNVTFNNLKKILEKNNIKIIESFKNDLEYTNLIELKINGKIKRYHLDLFMINNLILKEQLLNKKNKDLNFIFEEFLFSNKKNCLSKFSFKYINNIKTKDNYEILKFKEILCNNLFFIESFYEMLFEYYRVPFFSYHLGIILRKLGIKYSSKGVYYFISSKEGYKTDIYIPITYNLTNFLKILFNTFFNSNINNGYEIYKNINSIKELINFIENIKLYNYNFFKENNLKYEEERKIKSYEMNKIINEMLIKGKKDNFSSFFIPITKNYYFKKNNIRSINNLNSQDINILNHKENLLKNINRIEKYGLTNKFKFEEIEKFTIDFLMKNFNYFKYKYNETILNEKILLLKAEKKKILIEKFKKEIYNIYGKDINKIIREGGNLKEIVLKKLKEIDLEAEKSAIEEINNK